MYVYIYIISLHSYNTEPQGPRNTTSRYLLRLPFCLALFTAQALLAESAFLRK